MYCCPLYSFLHIHFGNISQDHTRDTHKAASPNYIGGTDGIFLQKNPKWDSVCAL